MAEENKPRVYGMADQANRHPPASQGMRGEQAAPGPRARDPEFAHMVTLENGKRVPVSEGNGVAFAEASGRIARAEDREIEVEFVPEEREEVAPPPPAQAHRRSRKPLLVGAVAAGAAAGIYLIERLRRSTDTQAAPWPRPVPMREGEASVPVKPETTALPVSVSHETGPLVPVQQLPHQQPLLAEISPAASQTSASSDRSRQSPDI